MTRIDFNKSAFEKANLIIRYFDGKLTEEEQLELDKWLSEDDANLPFLNSLKDKKLLDQELKFFSTVKVYTDLEKVKQRLAGNEPQKVQKRYYSYLKYAAIILVIISMGLGAYLKFHAAETTLTLIKNPTENFLNNIRPGRDNAKLELADGSVVILPMTHRGATGKIRGTSIGVKNGVLVYNGSSSSSSTNSYNRISTPKGGKYRVRLSDGTTVWLNSQSSIRFPTTFAKNERVVELHGEAYFDVAKNKQKPFRVIVHEVTVEALGTHFNINSYRNEGSIKTTLVEGSIKVSKGDISKLVVPGQQVEVKNKMTVNEVNVYESIAWKDDLFEFSDTDLGSIARQMERWYDVQIGYGADVASRHFTGTISRNTKIAQVLEMLKQTGLNYKLEERRIILYK